MSPTDGRFLEGLCAPPPGAVRKHGHITVGAGGDGVERIEARFSEKAFSPHRHDSYGIGQALLADALDMADAVDEFRRVDIGTALARQFRAAFGTSPSRFRTMRQLDRARRLMIGGTALAEAALEAGFADQSHLSRQFKRAYGMTPARWRAALEQKVV